MEDDSDDNQNESNEKSSNNKSSSKSNQNSMFSFQGKSWSLFRQLWTARFLFLP